MTGINSTKNFKGFALVIAVVTWFTVVLQYVLSTGSAVNYFSYFTIQNNLLVAISTTCIALCANTGVGKFFNKQEVLSGIALYIFVVALVYNTVLRGLVPLDNWGLLADTLLHVINPVLFIILWWLKRKHKVLNYKLAVIWLVYPLAYLVYTLVRGSMVNWYPYPFINAANLGWDKIIQNVFIMLLVFLLGGLVLIALTRVGQNKKVNI